MAIEEGDVEGSAMDGLIRLVASSSRFMQRADLSSAEEAEKRIHWPWLESPALLEALRPCAIIEDGEFDYDALGGGSSNFLMPGGSLLLTLTDNDRFVGQGKDGFRDFRKWQGQVIFDIAEKAGVDDHLDILAIRRIQKAIQSPPQQQPAIKPYWWSKWEIIWSTRGAGGGS